MTMTIGERIKNRRIELGLSVEELASLLGKIGQLLFIKNDVLLY